MRNDYKRKISLINLDKDISILLSNNVEISIGTE